VARKGGAKLALEHVDNDALVPLVCYEEKKRKQTYIQSEQEHTNQTFSSPLSVASMPFRLL
jgi:hypothetical protein